jgi:hypothetical protein
MLHQVSRDEIEKIAERKAGESTKQRESLPGFDSFDPAAGKGRLGMAGSHPESLSGTIWHNR